MKHFTQNLRWLLMSLLLVVGGSAWAEDYTYDFSTGGVNSSNANTWTTDYFTIVQEQGSSTSTVPNYLTAPRWYKNHTITFTPASGVTITKIVVNCSAANYNGQDISASAGSVSASGNNSTWTGSITSSSPLVLTMGKQCRPSSVVVTYSSGSSSDPSFTADNVDIAYNATGGEITYTVNNPVTGGSVSAATTSDWVTLSSNYASPIAFTCSANSGASPRTATVTLTYTYGSNSKTKNITITQAGNPDVVNNISDITSAGIYTIIGTIVAKSTRGFIVGDGTGYVYYYNTSYSQSDYNIGDKVKLSGSVVVYGGVFEFNNSTTVTSATESNYVVENPTVISGSDMDSRVSSTTPSQLSSYVQYEGKLSVNGTYYNITDIDGASKAQGSISFPINTDFTSLDGTTVKVTGYFVGVSSSTYYNTLIGSIEEVAGTVATPVFDIAEGTYSEAQTVAITCTTLGATIYYTTDGSDPTTSSTEYTGPISISATTTLKAIAVKGTNTSDIQSATYTIDNRTETYIRFTQGDDDLNYPSGSEFSITVGDNFISPEAWVTLPTGVYLTKSAAAPYLSFSGDNDAVATVNPSTGVLTFVNGASGTIKVTATFVGNTDYKPSEGYYTVKVKPEEVTPTGTGDEITYDFVGVTGTTYAEWSGKEGASGAVYAGKTAGGNTAVQMRTDGSDCGIVTTTSGGKVTMVTVDWNSNTSSSRTLDIYGSDEPYTSAADLYDSSTQGTKLGSICIDDATQLVITGDYAYIGIRSKNGALWCDKITIYWETTPDERTATTTTFNGEESYNVTLGETFTAPTATLDPATAGTLTYESSEPTVATVDSSSGAVSILAAGTTTITAKFAGDNNYKPSEASYTLTVTASTTVITSLQALQEATSSTTAQDVTLQLTDIYVTALKGTNNAYLSDGTYGALVYTNNHGLEAGKKFTMVSPVAMKSQLYRGATEITNFDATGLTITDGTLAPQTKTIDQITVANQSLPVKLENVTYHESGNTKTFTDGTNTIVFFDNFSANPTLVDGHVYNVTGIIVMYNNLQIAPLAATDVEDVTPVAIVEAPTFDPAGGTFDTDQNVTITCATEGATIYYTLDGTDPTTESTEYTSAIVITATTTLKAIASDGTNTSAIATATYTINKVAAPYAKGINSDYFVKVTDLNQLENGDAVIILNESADEAMETYQAPNNRHAKPETIIPWSANEFYVANTAETTQKFTLVKVGENYYFYANHGDAQGYLYAASKTSNQLKTEAVADDNAKASIVLDNGDATITFQGENTRNILRFNTGNNLFSCYAANSSVKDPVQIYVEVARPTETKTVTLTEATGCYKTIVAPYDLDLTESSLEAYIVTLNGDKTEANLTEVSKVPAGTPVILHSASADTYELTKAIAETDMDDVSANEMKVSKGDVEGDFDGSTATIYVLNIVNDQIGFYPLNSGKTLAAGKCYIELEAASGAKFIGFDIDDATGISDIATDKMFDGTVYNLSGQRVANPTKGIYIVNGKKVLVK